MKRTVVAMEHDRQGNCWDNETVYRCRRRGCRCGEMCDVCHDHDVPRGECDKCPPCPACPRFDVEEV